MITDSDVSLSRNLVHEYMEGDTLLEKVVFSSFSNVLTARTPKIGESVTIMRQISTYQKVGIEEAMKENYKNENSVKEEDVLLTKLAKPGFFQRTIHHLKESKKEKDSVVDVFYKFRVIDVVYPLYGNNRVVFYLQREE